MKFNNKKCNRIMNQYLELDCDERVPAHITFHLIFCKKCRRQVRLLTLAKKAVSGPLTVPVPLTDTTIENVMRQINPKMSEKTLKNPIHLWNWIINGILMIGFMLVFIPQINTSPANKNLLVAFCLVFAGCVTAYCALLVISNMDFFIKKMTTLKTAA
jgi:hypothetical protein